MAITYPISLPTSLGISAITLKAKTADAVSSSPYTFKQQVISHPGQRWEASVEIAHHTKNTSEPWIDALMSLKGKTGTFLLSDPNCLTPMGSAKTTPGTPLVNGGSQTGSTLNVDGLPVSVSKYLKAGDYIQLGAGSSAKLHKVLVDVNSNGSGLATLEIWPNLRSSPADNDPIVVANCAGVFRLTDDVSWDINSSSVYSIAFDCVEVL